jgi:hypothetical protein
MFLAQSLGYLRLVAGPSVISYALTSKVTLRGEYDAGNLWMYRIDSPFSVLPQSNHVLAAS